MTMLRALLLAAVLAGLAGTAQAVTAVQAFDKLVEEYLNGWLSRHPQTATRLGEHAYDRELRVVTQSTVTEDIAWLKGLRERLGTIPRRELPPVRALDHKVLAARLDHDLLELEVLKPHERNPNFYLDAVAGSIQSLLDRSFASPCEREVAITARLRRIPEVLRAAEVNLGRPPHLYTEVAIGQFTGALRLYREQVPEFAALCRGPAAEATLAEADSGAVTALLRFLDFLRGDLLARSDGDYRLGRDVFQRKLACDEMEAAPVESLLARGWHDLAATRARMQQVAARIAPGAPGRNAGAAAAAPEVDGTTAGGDPDVVRAALDSIARRHPRDEDLVAAVDSGLARIRTFVREKKLLTPPASERLIVRETPVFRRATSFASMEAPGVWETRATEAYYNVTPVEPDWSDRRKEEHLGFFNTWASQIVSIHEAIPGHYYQFLGLKRAPSQLRQAFGSGSNTEGWAHYCEQMAIEQGFGGDDPRYELAQLELQAQRLGRLIAAISLHTQGMSYEEAVRLFEDQCYMAPANAEREARRGAIDPNYLVYTLGKWRILELRTELKRRLGSRFRLRDFHDAFLSQGAAPLPVVREALLRELAGTGIAEK